jgi:hypothetical protein
MSHTAAVDELPNVLSPGRLSANTQAVIAYTFAAKLNTVLRTRLA